MATRLIRSCALLAVFASISLDANAFWWLFRATAGRTAVGAGVRAGAVGAVTTAEAEAAIATGARFCVRPVGAAACDFKASSSAFEAASRAVGSNYRVRPTARPTIFEVIDSTGNVVSIIQAVAPESDPTVASLPQYQPAIAQPSILENQEAPVTVAPLRHNGDVLNLHINGTPTQVWSDGYVEVWADNLPNRVVLSPGQRLHFPNHRTVNAVPKSSDAYTLFGQASGTP